MLKKLRRSLCHTRSGFSDSSLSLASPAGGAFFVPCLACWRGFFLSIARQQASAASGWRSVMVSVFLGIFGVVSVGLFVGFFRPKA